MSSDRAQNSPAVEARSPRAPLSRSPLQVSREVLLADFQVPEWVHDAVFYQIFPDRFALSPRVPKPNRLEEWDAPPTIHGFKGGDLVGVVEHLDYLEDLGVNAIYFTPIFKSTANHRYHTYDYHQVDLMLGGDPALRALLDEAHRRGMHVVLDGVFNHAGRGFFQFNHILENGEHSPYLDWFHVRSWPLFAYDPENQPAGYDAWWGLKALPEFNTSTKAVREFLFGVAERWIEFGIDGWRLDVPGEIDDDEFWREFRRRVKRLNPQAYIVGEIWHPAERWLQGDQFDAVMNYQFMRACLEFFIGARGDPGFMSAGYGTPQPSDAPEFERSLETLLHRYRPEVSGVMLNLLGSHDTPRFLTMSQNDEAALRMAFLMLMTFPGAPTIYYGDEIGMTGGKDPDMRRGMIWNPSRWNVGLRDYVKGCIRLRRAYPALRTGDFVSLYAAGYVYVFARKSGDGLCLVAFNAGDSTSVLDVPLNDWFQNGDIVIETQTGQHSAAVNGKLPGLKLPPRTGLVYSRHTAG